MRLAQNCVENKLVRSDQFVNFNAALKVRTNVRLLDVEIEADCFCRQQVVVENNVDSNNVDKAMLSQEQLIVVKPLHMVFLIDTSDSFNKLESPSSSAGEIILEKFVANFLQNGNLANRSQPVTATVIQFSGMGPDSGYKPGTGGKVNNTDLCHYKVELEPFNLSQSSNSEITNKIKKLNSVKMIDGNGQLFLALQDVSMDNFQKRIEKAAPGDSDKILVIVTDDEWDLKNLQLCSEINPKSASPSKEQEIINFAKSKFSQIYSCIVLDGAPNERLDRIRKQFGQNVFAVPRREIAALKDGGETATLDGVLNRIKKNIDDNFSLQFLN